MLMNKKAIAVLSAVLAAVMLTVFPAGCSNLAGNSANMAEEENSISEETETIVVGFSQLGAESNWRSANTESMKETFSVENGYEMIFEDGQQKQTNQITAIRRFIQQEVDYIVLAPVTETGWDTVLTEAKDAGIPVIIVDRMVAVEDDSLFTAWVGSNFELEGKKATEWLKEYCQHNGIAPSVLHIADIQGTIGASAQIGRTKALDNAAKKYDWDIAAKADGDFTELGGREAVNNILKNHDNINIIYCENDNSAFGAIEALEKAGYKVGSDITKGEIMIISFDGVNEKAMEYVGEGKISFEAECNPLLGPRVKSIIETLESGETPEKYTYVEESVFSKDTKINKLSVDGALYEVTIVE